ncbi:MAG: alanine racemase [Bacteroidetes bacterium]|nr:alanine racemase [Bacteroidota bacterium]
MKLYRDFKKPALLIDEKKCRENIRMMVAKARKHKVIFRPHFKTHQSLETGRWFRDEGVDRITVSSVEMAQYFSPEWNDITIAFPVNIPEIDEINELAAKINLNILAESAETVSFLKENLRHKTGIFIKIDIGNHRTGLQPDNFSEINKILDISYSSEKLSFRGFLGHAGQTYHCRSADEIKDIQKKSLYIMEGLKKNFIIKYPDLLISTGDTPGCSICDKFSGTDEIRPGNFVFYDLMQLEIGSCIEEQIAVAMACPIVAVHKERGEIVIYGGGIHFSKDRIDDITVGTVYGRIAGKKGNGWGKIIPDMFLKSLSQEHGIVSAPAEEISGYKIGDILFVIPVHSCMTADIMKRYFTLEGNEIMMMMKF